MLLRHRLRLETTGRGGLTAARDLEEATVAAAAAAVLEPLVVGRLGIHGIIFFLLRGWGA